VRLRGGEALIQKSRGGQSPRRYYLRSSDACVARPDLHIFPTLVKFSQKVGEVGGLASYRVRSSQPTHELNGCIILRTATVAGSARMPSCCEDDTAHR
jgi:hypothetical protein